MSKLACILPSPDFLPYEFHVRFFGEEEVVSIFSFIEGDLHTLNRPANEPISKTLKRFACTYSAKVSKNKKGGRKKGGGGGKTEGGGGTASAVKKEGAVFEGTEAASVVTVKNHLGEIVNTDDKLVNTDWENGMVIKLLQEVDVSFVVVKNAPAVTSLSTFPKSCLFLGTSIYPIISLEFASYAAFEWCFQKSEGEDWLVCGTGGDFTPEEAHVGGRLKLYATPWACTQHGGVIGDAYGENTAGQEGSGREKDGEKDSRKGRTVVFYLSGTVSDTGHAPKMLAVRREFMRVPRTAAEAPHASSLTHDTGASFSSSSSISTSTLSSSSSSRSTASPCDVTAAVALSSLRLDHAEKGQREEGQEEEGRVRGLNNLRVVTFNLLAEPFATSAYAKTHLYPYVPDQFLQSEYRLQLALHELVAYDADVICLQEVDCKAYEVGRWGGWGGGARADGRRCFLLFYFIFI